MKNSTKKIYFHKTNSFKKAEKFAEDYYLSLTSSHRLSEVQLCREEYYKIKKQENMITRKYFL